jgi:probable HAF family extracellular repeat protein
LPPICVTPLGIVQRVIVDASVWALMGNACPETPALRLPSLASPSPCRMACGINDAGLVVGQARVGAAYNHAVVWTAAAGMQDLNDLLPANSGVVLMDAQATSQAGPITGETFDVVNSRSFVCVRNPVAAVLEPPYLSRRT